MENIALTDGGPMYCLMSALWVIKGSIYDWGGCSLERGQVLHLNTNRYCNSTSATICHLDLVLGQ